MEEKRTEITPYQIQQCIEVASKVLKQMNTGIWHLSYEEMGLVLELIRFGMEKSRGFEGEAETEKGESEEVSCS